MLIWSFSFKFQLLLIKLLHSFFQRIQYQIFYKTMQPQTKNKLPFGLRKQPKKQQSFEAKVAHIDTFFRYKIASLYRQLKFPIYEGLLSMKKNKEVKVTSVKNIKKDLSIDERIKYQINSIHKYVSLNSKYHHRQKMRFSRTPLLKYLHYDFQALKEKLETKKMKSLYEDLHDSDQDEQPKKQYEKDNSVNDQTIKNYKKKNGIKGKIVVAYGYEDLKRRLIDEYGWTENEDYSSPIFDLKFMSKKKDIDYVNLLEWQMVNHFNENKSITAKFGLSRNVRNIVKMGSDPAEFFPVCFDVNDVCQLEDFYEEFKFSLLKSHVIKYVQSEGKFHSKIMINVIEALQKYTFSIEKKIKNILMEKQLYIENDFWKQLNEPKTQDQQQFDGPTLVKAKQLFEYFKENDPQFLLNQDNVWIIKPASMSRGRGIKTFNSINKILDYVIGMQISWVAQKYIERPLIIRKKKFDIRQWVLWTDFKPLRVWIYDECYIRFCASAYQPQNLTDRKIHLTNNSVTKGQNNQKDGIDGNMMNEEDFANELQEKQGKQIFKTKIKPQMQRIAVDTIKGVVQNVQSRKCSFELLGYDFMVDENYRVWLIEVNSSPTMEYSTKVTTQLVKKGMSDLGDLIENYLSNGRYYDHSKALKYGRWKLLTKS